MTEKIEEFDKAIVDAMPECFEKYVIQAAIKNGHAKYTEKGATA